MSHGARGERRSVTPCPGRSVRGRTDDETQPREPARALRASPSGLVQAVEQIGPSRSSSCAQTRGLAGHRDHPLALGHRRRRRRQRRPGHLGPASPGRAPAAWRARPADHALERMRQRAAGPGASPRRRLGLTPPALAPAPSIVPATTLTSSSGPSRAGHVLGLGGGDHGLAARAQQLRQQLAALGVELGHHVVEQHQRRASPALGQQLALREQQRQQRRRAAGPGSRRRAAATPPSSSWRSSRCGPWAVKPRSRSAAGARASSAASSSASPAAERGR